MDQSIIVKTPRRYVARSVWHNRSGQVTQPLARARNYANFLHVPGFNIIETPGVKFRFTSARHDARDEQASGLDRTGSGLKPIFGGSGLDPTAIFF